MLDPLQAERQLAAIEAASVPHLEQDAVLKIIRRHQRRMTPPTETTGRSLHEALLESGIPVKHVPTEKPAKAAGRAGTGRKGKRG